MKHLKDYLTSDMEVFFNAGEFSSDHNIDGKVISIIVDQDLLEKRQEKFAEGTYLDDVLFQVKKEEFGYKPAIGQHIKFDGETKFITRFQEDIGVYIITLGANIS